MESERKRELRELIAFQVIMLIMIILLPIENKTVIISVSLIATLLIDTLLIISLWNSSQGSQNQHDLTYDTQYDSSDTDEPTNSYSQYKKKRLEKDINPPKNPKPQKKQIEFNEFTDYKGNINNLPKEIKIEKLNTFIKVYKHINLENYKIKFVSGVNKTFIKPSYSTYSTQFHPKTLPEKTQPIFRKNISLI